MESIEIKGLRLYARHGVNPQERRVGNTFSVDITLLCDLSAAMESDDVNLTVNYAEVVEIVRREMAIPSSLLENVALRIRETIRHTFPLVAGGEVRVAKLSPPIPSSQLEEVAVTTKW